MKTRPKKLVFLAAFLLVLAGSFPAQIMALYGHSPFEYESIAGKLAPLNWAIMGLAPLTAWFAYRASRWLMATLPVLTGLVFYNNWLVGAVGTDYSSVAASVASAGFLLGIGALLNREALQVILNPSARWWMTPPRSRMNLPVRFKLVSRGRSKQKSQEAFNEFYIRIYDLAEGGAFIPVDQPTLANGSSLGSASRRPEAIRHFQAFGAVLRNLAIGTQCYLCLPLKDVAMIQCRAEIVRNTPGRGGYPAGVGIRFLGMTRADRRRLVRFIEHQVREGVGAGVGAADSNAGVAA